MKVGDRVRHGKYGLGTVTEFPKEDQVAIQFDSETVIKRFVIGLSGLVVVSKTDEPPVIQKPGSLQVGDRVRHPKYGRGIVRELPKEDRVVVFLESNELSNFVISLSGLVIVNDEFTPPVYQEPKSYDERYEEEKERLAKLPRWISNRRNLKNYARGLAHKFACSAEHFAWLAYTHKSPRVTIDLITMDIEPPLFDIDRNRNLAHMCRVGLLGNIRLLAPPATVVAAVLIADFGIDDYREGEPYPTVGTTVFTVTLTDERGRDWSNFVSVERQWTVA